MVAWHPALVSAVRGGFRGGFRGRGRGTRRREMALVRGRGGCGPVALAWACGGGGTCGNDGGFAGVLRGGGSGGRGKGRGGGGDANI